MVIVENELRDLISFRTFSICQNKSYEFDVNLCTFASKLNDYEGVRPDELWEKEIGMCSVSTYITNTIYKDYKRLPMCESGMAYTDFANSLMVGDVHLYERLQTVSNSIAHYSKWYSPTMLNLGFFNTQRYRNIRTQAMLNYGAIVGRRGWVGAIMINNKVKVIDVSGHIFNILTSSNFYPDIDMNLYLKVIISNIKINDGDSSFVKDYDEYKRLKQLGEQHFGISEKEQVFHTGLEYLMALDSYDIHAQEMGYQNKSHYLREQIKKIYKGKENKYKTMLYTKDEAWLSSKDTVGALK